MRTNADEVLQPLASLAASTHCTGGDIGNSAAQGHVLHLRRQEQDSPLASMSAWSSAASGKGSALSYAERLRRAKEDSSRGSADSPAAASGAASSSAPTLTQLSPPPPAPLAPQKPAPSSGGAWKVVTPHKGANGRADVSHSASSSSTSIAHEAHSATAAASHAAASASTTSAGASQAKAPAQPPAASSGAARPAASAPRPPAVSAAPSVNVWEQRRKQLAEKSAESRQEATRAPAAGKAQAEPAQPVKTSAPPAPSTAGASASASSSTSAGGKAAVTAQPPASVRSATSVSAAHDALHPAATATKASSGGEEESSKQSTALSASSIPAPSPAEASPAKAAERRNSTDANLQGDSPITRSIAESTLPFVPRSPLSLARSPTGPAYDNAWLDRIHLLNGGQNMPTFAPALQESAAEMGIGAGLQPAPAVSMPPSLPSTAEEPSLVPTPTSAETQRAWQKATTSVAGAPGEGQQNGAVAALTAPAISSSVETATASHSAADASAPTDAVESSTRRRTDSTSSRTAAPASASKSKARRAQAAPIVLADSESWPSPLDATAKTAARSKARAESVSAGADGSGERPAATEKSLEGLDVQVAKGAGDKSKKGKQWIPIVPTITHTSPLPASGRKTTAKDAASKGGPSSATSPHPKKAGKARSDKGAASGEKRPDHAQSNKRGAKANDKENVKASNADTNASSAAPNGDLAPAQGQAGEPQMPPAALASALAEAAGSGGASNGAGASSAADGGSDAAAPMAAPSAQPAMHMTLSDLPAMFPPMRWTSGSPGPPSPFPFVPPPQRLNKDGSFSPTRATDFLAPKGDLSWHTSHSPVRHSARGRGSRGRGRGGRHAGGDVFSGSRNDGAFVPVSGAEGVDLDGQGVSSSRDSPASGSYAAGAQLPFWLHGGQPHALPVFQPQGMAPAPPANGDWQQQPPPARAAGIDAPTHQLLKQIEFYFSERNLQGDFFLRQRMDAQGWVSISTVAGFNRVQRLTSDLALVRDTLMYSSVLEVDASNMRVRKAQNWESFVLGANGAVNGAGQQSRPSSAQAGMSEQHFGSGAGANGYANESSNADGRSTTTVMTETSRSKCSTAFSSPPSSATHQDSGVEDGGSDSYSDDKEDQETLGVVAAEGLGGTLFPPGSKEA